VSRRNPWGLRARLIIALVGVALLAADMATIYSNLNLDSHVAVAAEARLQRSATHFGDVAGVVFAANRGWTDSALATLRHLAMIDDLAVQVDAAGRTVLSLPPSATVVSGASATAPVQLDGRTLGTVKVSQLNGQLLTAEEVRLTHQLNRMHLIAGIVSAVVAFFVALYLAFTLSRPLREIRTGAEAMGAGDLEARVRETGDAEMRSVARALNLLATTLQHEEELRKASVADLAHELRTPLMGLLGRIEAAQDGVLADDASNLAAMHDEALRLGRLLDDISALADAESPGMLLTLEQIDLAVVVTGQVNLLADTYADKGIALTRDLRPTVVAGDPKRLEQIVVNLLSNALRYTDAGGRVTVVVRAEGGNGVLEVADTGIGISAEDLPHVFSRFWRGDKSRSRATGGAGIGLSIVQELVRAHGGHVAVQSVVGEGSVFRVVIPTSATPTNT
jgi:two-component system sensor histidine kinase BaeS